MSKTNRIRRLVLTEKQIRADRMAIVQDYRELERKHAAALARNDGARCAVLRRRMEGLYASMTAAAQRLLSEGK